MNAITQTPVEQMNFSHSHVRTRHVLYIFWFCGEHNFLLPLQEFTCCLRGISTTLSFSQHFCLAFPDTLSATCPIPSLLHGQTNSLAPPADFTPLTSPNTPLKNKYYSLKTANPDESTFSSLLCFSLPLLHGQMTARPAGGKRPAAEHYSRGSSSQLLLIDSSKGSKAPFSLFFPTLFPYKLHNTLTRLPFTSPLLSSVKRWENQSRASSKGNRRLTEWSLTRNNRRGGLRGRQKGGELKETNWESLPGTVPCGTTTGTRKSLLPLLIITSRVPHKHTPTDTRTLT